MIKVILLISVATITSLSLSLPKKYTSRTGHLHIESTNRFMNIVSDNYQVYCDLDPSNGNLSFTGLMKSFEFKLGVLDRAFNSDKIDLGSYTKFVFNGKLLNFKDIPFEKPGKYKAKVKGTLLMGNYKRVTVANGTFEILPSGRILADAVFTIRIEEESVQTINELMRKKLPSIISLDMDKLGVSRDIQLSLRANYRPRK